MWRTTGVTNRRQTEVFKQGNNEISFFRRTFNGINLGTE